jgi:DNA-binding NarL/FixJ family response regulator
MLDEMVDHGRAAPGALVRVLIVDDVPDIRRLITFVLEHHGGFEVVGEAGDGEEAIRQTEVLRPDVVLLDLSMPVMDGLEALPVILASSPQSKVLVLSGFDSSEMSAEATRLGAVGYMEKGVIAAKLGQVLLDLVPERPIARRLASPPPETERLSAGEQRERITSLVRALATPVAVIGGFADLLVSGDDLSPNAAHNAASSIARSSQQLASLVLQLCELCELDTAALDTFRSRAGEAAYF